MFAKKKHVLGFSWLKLAAKWNKISLSPALSRVPLLQWNTQLRNWVVMTQSSSSNPLFPRKKILRLTNFMVKQRNLDTAYHLSPHDHNKDSQE